MEKHFFKIGAMVLAVLVMGLAGCSKSTTTTKLPEGSKAFVTISVKGTTPSAEAGAPETKSFDDENEGRDQAARINDLTVFFMDAHNNIVGQPVYINQKDGNEYTPNADGSIEFKNIEIQTNTNAKYVYVVGNTGDPLAPEGYDFSWVRNLEDLQGAYLVYNPEQSGSMESVWIEGRYDGELNFETGRTSQRDGQSPVAFATDIVMRVIISRVDVTVNNCMKNWDETAGDRMMLESVAFLYSSMITRPVQFEGSYVPAYSDMMGMYMSGYGDYPKFDLDNPVRPTMVAPQCHGLFAKWEENIVNTEFGDGVYEHVHERFEHSFYGLPNGDYKPHIITVVATTADGKVYFPVHFATTDTNEVPFENGKLYKMTINLTGDARTGGGGTTDPEDRVSKAYVTVTITPAEWTVVHLPVKEF